MYSWNKERQDVLYKQKLQNVKSTLPKVQSNQSQGHPKKKQFVPDKSSHLKQQNLKYLLREFGLIQYLRKMYELGYDDYSLVKLGMLSQKEFEELIFNIKVFPGHQVKMQNFFNYLKQNIMMRNTNAISPKKPGTSHASNYRPMTHTRKTQSYSAKPKMMSYVPKERSNQNPMLNSFMRGEFGYDYYCDNNSNSNTNNRPNDYLDGNKLMNVDSTKLSKEITEENVNYDANENNCQQRDMDMDTLLDYYMAQLNEKLDDSYDSIEDSSLSNARFNEIVKTDEVWTGNKQSNPNRNRDEKNDSKGITIENISEIKSGNQTNIAMTNHKDKDSSYQCTMNKTTSNNNGNDTNSKAQENNVTLPKLGNDKEKKGNNDNDTKKKQQEQQQKEESKPVLVPERLFEIPNEQPRVITQERDKEDEIIEEFFEKEEAMENAQQQQQGPKFFSKEHNNQVSRTEGNEHPHHTQQTNSAEDDKAGEDYDGEYTSQQQTDSDQKPYSKEQMLFDNIRLTKSCEGDSLRQNPEQFDIEYMCRCLGLAVMKHLESSKDKTHITDLLTQNETFEFFNSLYNSNFSFIQNFFNKDKSSIEQISNLDRIDLIEKTAEENDSVPISFMKHVKKEGDVLPKIEDNGKKKTHFGELEKDIRFIDEFFSVSKKIRYKNLSERTMNLLNKELSYINEVDSQMSSRLDNSNLTNRKETTDNILRQSLHNILTKNNEGDANEVDKQQMKHNLTEPNIKSIGINNKFSSVNHTSTTNNNNTNTKGNNEDDPYKSTPLHNSNKIIEDIAVAEPDEQPNEVFESGEMESNYIIDVTTIDKLKSYLLKQAEIYDDDYLYSAQRIQTRKYVAPPDPQTIFEFCANIMILTKMEKEVIIVALIYIERLIFNTGLLLSSRNWRRIIFTALVIASKIWDDDSFENNHFAQVFTHLKIGEINLLERVYLELINYKVFVKCSEYFKYFFIIKSIALKYNYNGMNLVPISVEQMMKIQEYAYQMQKKLKKRYSLCNSASF